MLEAFQIVLFLLVLLIFLYVLLGRVLERFKIHFLHESGLGIVMGWLIGLMVYFIYRDELTKLNFNDNLFFYGLLPPIIFAAGYNLKKKKFFQYFFYITLYGVVGTIICFLVTFGLTIVINNTNMIIKFSIGSGSDSPHQTLQLSMSNILLFSATICASDSVAALTLIGQNYDKVFSIVFGESLINDAVAIVLFRSIDTLGTNTTFNPVITLKLIGLFIYILLTSVLVGLFFAILCCIIFKKCRFLTTNPVSEVVCVILFGLMGYSFAEMFDLSGVISLLVIGITLSHYNFYNLSMTGQVSTGVALQSISTIAEGFIFVYLGLNFWTIFKDQNGNDYWWSWSFVGLELLVCAAGRVVSVFIVSFICKLIKRDNWKVTCREMNVIWYAGIVRGSVAFALILTLQASSPEELNQIQVLKSSVLFMVFFSTIVIGGFMPLVIKCSLKEGQQETQDSPKEIELKIMGQQDVNAPVQRQRSKASRCWSHLDEKFFKKWLIYRYEERSESIRTLKQLIRKQTQQSKQPYLSILMASINSNSQRADHPDLEQEKESETTAERKPSL